MGLFDSLFNHYSASSMSDRNFAQSIALQNHQFDLNKRALQEFYTNHRKSLVDAGYNPLLAVPGSTAQGFSASAGMSSSPGSASGIGTDEANAVNSALSGKQLRSLQSEQVKQIKENTENTKLRNDYQRLQNQKLKNEINSSPRTILGELVSNGESKTGNSAMSRLVTFKNSYGLSSLQPRNFIRTNISRIKNLANQVKSTYSAKSSLNNGKPFQLGIKYFDEPNSNETIGVWNSNRRVKGNIMSDDEAKRYFSRKSSKTYNKPPKTFPR